MDLSLSDSTAPMTPDLALPWSGGLGTPSWGSSHQPSRTQSRAKCSPTPVFILLTSLPRGGVEREVGSHGKLQGKGDGTPATLAGLGPSQAHSTDQRQEEALPGQVPPVPHRPSGNLRTAAARGRGKKHAFREHVLCGKDSACVISSSPGTSPGFTISTLKFRFKVAQLLRPEARCLKQGPCTSHIARSPLPFPENH